MPQNILQFKSKSEFKIRNKAEEKAEILIYGPVGSYWDESAVTAKAFVEEMKNLKDVKEITLRLNSPGGDVFDGWTIYNRLKQHPAKKKVYIDGMAASIASVIALAGDEIIMGEGAQIMIHNAWTMAYGNAEQILKVVNQLEEIDSQLVSLYAKKSGLTREEIKKMMSEETWMSADVSIENGFADKKAEETYPIAACILDKAIWLKNKPANLKTSDDQVREKVAGLHNKVSDFLARNKRG